MKKKIVKVGDFDENRQLSEMSMRIGRVGGFNENR